MGKYPSTYRGAQSRKRLTRLDVEMIHSHCNVPTAELARQMGFSPTTIHNVRVGNTWPELHPAHESNKFDTSEMISAAVNNYVPQVSSSQTFDGIPDNIEVSSSLEELMEKLGGGESRAVVHPPSVTGTAPILPTHISYPPDISNLKRLPGITVGREDTDDEMF